MWCSSTSRDSSTPALPVIADAGALWVVVAADVSPDELKPFVDAVWDIPRSGVGCLVTHEGGL